MDHDEEDEYHKTVLNRFYRITFRKKVYTRPHQGRGCFGKTSMQTFLDALPMMMEKMIAA